MNVDPYLKLTEDGLPWWSSGSDSVLPLQRTQVQSLVWETKILHETWLSQNKQRKDGLFLMGIIKNG